MNRFKIDVKYELENVSNLQLLVAVALSGVPSLVVANPYLNLLLHFPHLLEDGAALPLAQPQAAPDADAAARLHRDNF